jgi:hypothetical protein
VERGGGARQIRPWVLGTFICERVKLESVEDCFEPVLNMHPPFPNSGLILLFVPLQLINQKIILM